MFFLLFSKKSEFLHFKCLGIPPMADYDLNSDQIFYVKYFFGVLIKFRFFIKTIPLLRLHKILKFEKYIKRKTG